MPRFEQSRASTVQQSTEEVFAALWYAASFHCLVEEWHDCEELKPKTKENEALLTKQERPRSIARSGVRPQADTVAGDAGGTGRR